MYSDYHIHSCFSFDSDEKPEIIVNQAIKLNMKQICFTDHQDFDWPVPGESPIIDTPQYFNVLSALKDKYKNKIKILIGVELGLMPSTKNLCHDFIDSNPFDFVIGSCHIVNGNDPYYSDFWQNRSDHDAFELYFNTLMEDLNSFDSFDTLAHFDYIVRYSPNKYNNYSVFDYTDVIDNILKHIIYKDIKLEINTSNLARGINFTNPHIDIIKRYKELGGQQITVGSDAHKASSIGTGFDVAKDIIDKFNLHVFTC